MPPPPPTITISTPADGATVGRPFTASGTYSSPTPNPTISVVLKDSSGATVATGGPIAAMGGQWAGPVNPSQAYSGATLYAEIVGTAANDSATNITVN